jgi:hypothetical protein
MDALHELGISGDEIEIITGSPVRPEMMGRHHPHSKVPLFALGGSIFGMGIGFLLAFVTPRLYPLNVGGKGLSPGGPSIILMFEMIMLFMLIFTFVGVFLESVFPDYTKKEYHPEISDGDIAIVIDIDPDQQSALEDAMKNAGAKTVRVAEREEL